MSEDRNLLDKLKDKARATAEGLKRQYGIGQNIESTTWPQTKYEPSLIDIHPNYKTRGFLPPTMLLPNAEFTSIQIEEKSQIFDNPILGSESANSYLSNFKTVPGPAIEKKYGQYKYIDWRGHMLDAVNNSIEEDSTKNKFDESEPEKFSKRLKDEYSTRDSYLIFGDSSTDYFRHGLHIIDKVTPIENPINGESIRLGNFKNTPFENNDPIIYGFEIIIDDVSSPLLNGSIIDFLSNYSSLNEISARIPVYEDFKQQFVKFFKTKATVRINDSQTSITKMRSSSYPEEDSNKQLFQSGRKAYMSYYIKKVGGLEKLIEQNTPSTKKYLAEYNKDVITIDFTEDVSMSVGTLAHLYKLLYWSKPNGKGIIPENLLRFNCDIIVSEVRNFRRVKKAVDTGNIEIIKDNVSRYIYSLKECQFYFNTMPHEASIDIGTALQPFGNYTIQFDYKYSTVKLERFVPTQNGSGQYVGYDSGAIWKIGNSGERDNRELESNGRSNDSSVPKFYTVGQNILSQNGVNKEFVVSVPQNKLYKRTYEEDSSVFEGFKQSSKFSARKLANKLVDTAINSANRELQSIVNTQTAILNRTLNKILSANGIVGIRPPRNIYTDAALNAGQRIFYDVRGDLINFVGDSVARNLGGGGISGGAFSPR
jgi:hypothetical protein